MKALYSGHCQVCGGLQKLPNGVLSLHGYKVEYGFFSGICKGAKALPFEQAHDLVDASIVRAQAHLTHLVVRQARLRARATEPVAVIMAYVKDARTGRSRHEWQRHEIKTEWHEYPGGRYAKFFWGEKPLFSGANVLPDSGTTDVLNACTAANTKYAEWLESEATSLRSYIAWQTMRVRTWKVAPLVPVTTKDPKATFKPEEPRYSAVDGVKD